MTRAHTKGQGQMSRGSGVKVEIKRMYDQSDGRTESIALPASLTRSVIINLLMWFRVWYATGLSRVIRVFNTGVKKESR